MVIRTVLKIKSPKKNYKTGTNKKHGFLQKLEVVSSSEEAEEKYVNSIFNFFFPFHTLMFLIYLFYDQYLKDRFLHLNVFIFRLII